MTATGVKFALKASMMLLAMLLLAAASTTQAQQDTVDATSSDQLQGGRAPADGLIFRRPLNGIPSLGYMARRLHAFNGPLGGSPYGGFGGPSTTPTVISYSAPYGTYNYNYNDSPGSGHQYVYEYNNGQFRYGYQNPSSAGYGTNGFNYFGPGWAQGGGLPQRAFLPAAGLRG